MPTSPAPRPARAGAKLFAAAVAAAGIARRDATAARAIEMFVAILGAEAGSLALRFFATGGVFIGGGIAPKILPALRWRAFGDAFTDKGRLERFLRNIPVASSRIPAPRCWRRALGRRTVDPKPPAAEAVK